MENTTLPLGATQVAPTKERSITHRVNEMVLIASNTENVYNSIVNGQFKQASEQLNEELEKIHGTLEDWQKSDEYDIVDIKKGRID